MKPWHIIVVLLVIIVIFGAAKLPDIARSLGQSAKVLKKEMRELQDDVPPGGYPQQGQAQPGQYPQGQPGQYPQGQPGQYPQGQYPQGQPGQYPPQGQPYGQQSYPQGQFQQGYPAQPTPGQPGVDGQWQAGQNGAAPQQS